MKQLENVNYVDVILDKDIPEIIKVMSYKTQIYKLPQIFVDLISHRTDITIQTIKYVPYVYYQLDESLKNNKAIKRAMKTSLKNHRKKKNFKSRKRTS